MRIVLNTHRDDPSSRVCIFGLHRRLVEAGYEATLNDWNHYDRYDVAVFMAYDHDMAGVRRQQPGIRVVLADPKQSTLEHIAAARAADLLMVSSVEQRDRFYRLNRNLLVHYMFPRMPPRDRTHAAKDTIVIGYHGNRVHLECMWESVRPALNALGQRRPIEFRALYNVELLGRARIGMPDADIVKVRHIQWSPERAPDSDVTIEFYRGFSDVDIGVMPTLMPIKDRLSTLEACAYQEPEFMYEPFDHLIRFKASCNPGRLYPYGQLLIPVVADFAPSASQFIQDGESGFIVSSPEGWFEALESLAACPELRNRMARNLRASLTRAYAAQVSGFIRACEAPLRPGAAALGEVPGVEAEFGRLAHYARPRGPGYFRRVLRRFGRVPAGRQPS